MKATVHQLLRALASAMAEHDARTIHLNQKNSAVRHRVSMGSIRSKPMPMDVREFYRREVEIPEEEAGG